MSKRRPSFIDAIEADAVVVADRLMNLRDSILSAMAPDGRAFKAEKLTERERLRDYVMNLRGNPAAWQQRIAEEALRIQTAVEQVNPELVPVVHPWDLAVRVNIAYSAAMERLREREEERI